MSIDLDTRLRSAAHSLHDAADHLEPTGPPRDRRPLRAGALTVLVVVALVAVTVVRQDDDGGPAVSTNPDDLPRMILGDAYEELVPRGGVNLPSDMDGSGPSDMDGSGPAGSVPATFYGNPDADDPFAEADLMVSAYAVETPTEPLFDPIDVRGTRGDLLDVPGGLELTWTEGDNLYVVLSSHTLDRDQLVAAAEALVVDGQNVTLPGSPPGVPAPLEEVASVMRDRSLGDGLGVPTSAPGYYVGYQGEGDSPSLSLTMVEGGATELAALRWFGLAHEVGSIAGRDGWIGHGTYQFGATYVGEVETPHMAELSTFVWEEAPGVLASIRGRGLSPDELEAMVESLRPATDEEWRELRERRLTSLYLMDPDSGGMGGGFATDRTWNVYRQDDGTVCGAFTNDSGTGVTCGTAAVALRAEDGTAIGVFGMVPPGAVSTRDDSLNIRFVGADTDDWSGSGNEEDGEIYVAMFEDGELPSAVEFRDENGEVVSTVPVEG